MESMIEIIIGSNDIDLMNHVNNQVYIKYLELGRSDFYLRAGYPFEKFVEEGIGRTIVDLKIKYYKEAVLGQRLLLYTFPLEIGRSSIKFKQEIYNEENEKISDAEVTSVIIDLQKRRSTEVPKQMLIFIKDMIEKRISKVKA